MLQLGHDNHPTQTSTDNPRARRRSWPLRRLAVIGLAVFTLSFIEALIVMAAIGHTSTRPRPAVPPMLTATTERKLELFVARHEARAWRLPMRELHVTCTGHTCRLRTCQPFGSVSINGGPFVPLPPQWIKETVTVDGGRFLYGALIIGGDCRRSR